MRLDKTGLSTLGSFELMLEGKKGRPTMQVLEVNHHYSFQLVP